MCNKIKNLCGASFKLAHKSIHNDHIAEATNMNIVFNNQSDLLNSTLKTFLSFPSCQH